MQISFSACNLDFCFQIPGLREAISYLEILSNQKTLDSDSEKQLCVFTERFLVRLGRAYRNRFLAFFLRLAMF